MKIGIDVLVGDFASDVNLEGVSLARKKLMEDTTIALIGDQDTILSGLSSLNESTSLLVTAHVLEMSRINDRPTRVIRTRPNSSLAIVSILDRRFRSHAFNTSLWI
jgi:glycerol-3-phosphate acyltransferase PlsX